MHVLYAVSHTKRWNGQRNVKRGVRNIRVATWRS